MEGDVNGNKRFVTSRYETTKGHLVLEVKEGNKREFSTCSVLRCLCCGQGVWNLTGFEIWIYKFIIRLFHSNEVLAGGSWKGEH